MSEGGRSRYGLLTLFPSPDGMMHDECMVGIGGTPVHWYPTGTSRWDAILRPSVYKRLALPSVRNYTSYAKYRPAPLRNHGEAKKILCSQPALTCDAQPLAAIRDAIGAQIYLSLTVLRDQGRSIHHSSGTSHNASEPGKLHSRARLRDLDLAWLRTCPGRSALACG